MLALSRNKQQPIVATSVRDDILPIILEYAQGLIFQLNKDFLIRKMSRQAALQFSWSSDEVLGQDFIALCEKYFIECPIPESILELMTQKKVLKTKTTLLVKGQRNIEIAWRLVPVSYEAIHNDGYLLIGEMQTQANNAPVTAYSEQLDWLRLFENAPVYFAHKDNSGYYLGANRSFAELMGETSSSIVGKSDFDLSVDAGAAMITRADDQMIFDGTHRMSEVKRQYHHAGGTMTLRMHRFAVINDQDEVEGVIQVGIDITHYQNEIDFLREQRHQIQSQAEAKSNFIELLSLDVRTLLRSVTNTAQSTLMQSEADSTHLRCVINALAQRNEMLIDLFDHMLDASRIEVGRIVPNQIRTGITACFEGLLSKHMRVASSKQIHMQLGFCDDIELMLDAKRLEHILHHILKELIAFLHGGKILLDVHGVAEDARTAWLEITLRASGVSADGVDLTELLSYLLGKTQRFDHRMQASGIQLVVLRQLILAMGGRIEASADELDLSTLSISIPAEMVEALPIRPESTERAVHVLLIEDNLLNQKVERLMLEDLGCVVDVSCNGHQAIDYFTTRRYDLVFMDIGLPEMDGFEITKRFRDIERMEHQSPTPIIALTAHAFLDDGAGCRDAGMNDIMLKPAASKELDAVIKQWCQRRACSL